MFSWDNTKNKLNKNKHGISFETAKYVFDDAHQITRQDRLVNGEQRWQTIGLTGDVVLVLVAHTWQELENGEDLIHIISARRATKLERLIYEQNP